ncbi:hypothetical protein M427DRAFT_30421 [Gonapodya prolifera JEL478]|uniref:Dynein regulatory complex protein 12 n=1 Tax=Gonapodya prolifera (strain JEL478) TaxID=1344416 RepID=A0A139ALH1_GONPJ|nr:hypothetical protein M427DRAFT_30421 [Gonapodya prolifera JEL478]|eukprot:KXS17637.1 hypothetical protein M427DRAFT_30421 [Gonapodya prolifera JEL478]
MSAKKPKTAKSKPKAKTASSEDAEEKLVLGEKLAKVQAEAAVLQQELEIQRDLVVRLRSQATTQKQRIQELEELVERRTVERIEVENDMKAQINRLKSEMVQKVTLLQTELENTQAQFARTNQANESTIRDLNKNLNEKEILIDDQNAKMMFLSSEFEAMLNETLSKITEKLGVVNQQWDDVQLSQLNQGRLSDFNLTRLALE